MAETVKFIKETFEYIPSLGVSGWLRLELVEAHTFIDETLWTQDPPSTRHMLYHRWSVSGATEYEVLFEQPFGLGTVSG